MAATETPTEQQQQEQEQEQEQETATNGDNSGLFNAAQYDDPELRLSKVDGQSIDKIKLAFSGQVMLDRGNKADVELYRKLSLGKGDVTLMVEGRCSSSGAKQSTNRAGDLDVIVGEKTVKIETVYVSTADGVTHAVRGEVTEDDRDGGEPLGDTEPEA